MNTNRRSSSLRYTFNAKTNNYSLVGLTTVNGDEDIMLVTDQGVIIRFGIESVSQTGRSAVGVHLIKMDNGARVATIAKVDKEVDEETEEVTDNSSQEENQPTEN